MHDSELRARDLMQRDVIALSPDSELADASRLFCQEEIHGAPVVDDDGTVRGVVSVLDLVRIPDEERQQLTVGDVMTTELVSLGPDASLEEVARTMLDQRVHRVLVVDGDSLQGVISTFDLVRALTGYRPRAIDPAHAHATGYRR